MNDKKIRVLIVDDSAFIREMFTRMLSSAADIEVLGGAEDPFVAREMIKKLNPDVITLDIEMPKMDGISFLEKIMTLRPMPVVMASTLTQKGAEVTMRALELGAIDYVSKPSNLEAHANLLLELQEELIEKVRAAAMAKIGIHHSNSEARKTTASAIHFTGNPRKSLIAIGASTGGVEAIRDVLTLLPADSPPIVITQHMPPVFTKSFATRLSTMCKVEVHEAEDGMLIEQGHAYIAPGSHHMILVRKAGHFYCKLDDGPPVSSHRPSVDVMMSSVAEQAKEMTVACILTGMGKDGAAGLLRIRQAGGATFGEDERTCIVYGMPKVAAQIGAVEKVVPLHQMAQELIRACNTRK